LSNTHLSPSLHRGTSRCQLNDTPEAGQRFSGTGFRPGRQPRVVGLVILHRANLDHRAHPERQAH